MARARKATVADAELCIKLFELRREAEMRKARDFVNFKFNPKSAEEFLKVMMGMGTQENAWVRQVFSFWESVASLVLADIIQPDLFLAWNGEMIFTYTKFAPFLKEIRAALDNPNFLGNLEKAIKGSTEMRKRVTQVQKMLARFAAQSAKA
jgi:hypothetical protein